MESEELLTSIRYAKNAAFQTVSKNQDIQQNINGHWFWEALKIDS